jgi:hypothetical protein
MRPTLPANSSVLDDLDLSGERAPRSSSERGRKRDQDQSHSKDPGNEDCTEADTASEHQTTPLWVAFPEPRPERLSAPES